MAHTVQRILLTELPVWASLIAQLVKNPSAMWGDPGSIPGLGRSPGEGINYPLQYSWASLAAQLVNNLPVMWDTWVVKIPWRREKPQQPVENSERDGKTRPPDLPPEKSACRSRSKARTGHGTTDWFQIGKVCQGCILSPCLCNLYAEYFMWNARLDEAQAGIKIAGEVSITSDTQMIPPLWQKAKKN